MTCIVGLVEDETIFMGCDSMVTTGYTTQLLTLKKVFRNRDMLIGFSGSVRMCNLLQYAFTIPEHPDYMSIETYLTTSFIDALRTLLKDTGNATKTNEQEQSLGYFLLGYKKRLFTIGSDYSLIEVMEGYNSVGSGSEIALGAMFATQHSDIKPKKRIELALKAATHYCNGVNEPYYFEAV